MLASPVRFMVGNLVFLAGFFALFKLFTTLAGADIFIYVLLALVGGVVLLAGPILMGTGLWMMLGKDERQRVLR